MKDADRIDAELADEFINSLLEILQPQLDGTQAVSVTQHRDLQREVAEYTKAVQKKAGRPSQ